MKSSLLSTVASAPRKTISVHSDMSNIIPDKLHLFEQKDRIENIIKIQNKLNPADINNSFIMYKCNEKFIIQSIDFLV